MNYSLSSMLPVTNIHSRKTKIYKVRRDGDDNNFKQLYRFNRENVDYLASQFLDDCNETRGGALNNVQKIKCFLRYVGDPGFQVGVGEDLGVHQSTVSKVAWNVCTKIVSKANDWIEFPSTTEEYQKEMDIWKSKYKIPYVIGAIDCTHILIKKPALHGDEYINRKTHASFNVQATCNGREMFTSVDCKWPGSVHDARIWRNSSIQSTLNENIPGCILLGDEGYPLTPWLMTPFKNPQTIAENNFNKNHCKELVIIERLFGQLKQRFPILQSKMRILTERVPSMVIACFILHNVAKFLMDEDFEYIHEESTDNLIFPDDTNDSVFRRGLKRRECIASYLINEYR